MDLELKHLVGYLPYKLKIKYQERSQVMNLGEGHSLHWIGIKSVVRWQNVNGEPPKPIVRPLSDLINEIEETGDRIIYQIIEGLPSTCDAYLDWLESCEFNVITPEKLLQAPYELVQYMLENHYDIYGLIDAGLAIEIKTLDHPS